METSDFGEDLSGDKLCRLVISHLEGFWPKRSPQNKTVNLVALKLRGRDVCHDKDNVRRRLKMQKMSKETYSL